MTDLMSQKALVLRLYREALNQARYPDVVDQLVDADAVTHDALGSRSTGAEAVMATMSALHRAFSDMIFIVDDVIAEDSRVAVRWHMTGRHTGPFAGHPATGRTVSQRAIVIYRLEHGKVVEIWPMIDRLGMLEQISGTVTPARPASPTAELPAGEMP